MATAILLVLIVLAGWIVPAYTMAPNLEELAVLRVVVREGLSRDMADMLLSDIGRAVEELEKTAPPEPATAHGSKTHGVC